MTATATDLAGTTSPVSATLKVVIDTQPPQSPVVTGISPDTGKSNDGITTAKNLIFSGTSQAGTSVSIFLNGGLVGTTTAGTGGTWTFDNTGMSLANGNYAVTAVATDLAGNLSNPSSDFNLTVETVQPPVIAGASLITGPAQGLPNNQQALIGRRNGSGQ